MTAFVALLRAVNVGGVKLVKHDLKALCEDAGLRDVGTYIASGNAVFSTDAPEDVVRSRLETRLERHLGTGVAVFVRSAGEMRRIVEDNPFRASPPSVVTAHFLHSPVAPEIVERAIGRAEDEAIALGRREVYLRYGAAGIGRSKLRLPLAQPGTARNMTTVAALAKLATQRT